jgi:hypothetical protein
MSWRDDFDVPRFETEQAMIAAVAAMPEWRKKMLRPVAETIAMLDGNAFFGMRIGDHDWWEMYLPEADALFEANGGLAGWASAASFAQGIVTEGGDAQAAPVPKGLEPGREAMRQDDVGEPSP